jgi:hypothetical protein
VLDGGDGAVLRIGWQDIHLDMACRFLTASDGSIRCLPDASASSARLSNDGVVYADEACTKPLFAGLKSKAPPFVVGEAMMPEACGAPAKYTAHALGEPTTAPAKVYQRHLDDCHLVDPVGDDEQLYALGPAVPPELFVGATEALEPRGDELAARVFEASDGAREVFGAFDIRRGVACSIRPPSAQLTGPCLPLDYGVAVEEEAIFGDEACAAPAAAGGVNVLGSDICQDTVITVHTDCDGIDALHFAADEVQQPYLNASDSCTAVDVPPGYQYFSLGASVDVNSFPQLGLGETGEGAVRVRWTAAPSGVNLVPGGLVDAARGAACWAETTCDGVERCVPSNPARFQADSGPFADPECSEPVVLLANGECDTALPDTLVLSSAGCSDESLYYARGEVVTEVYERDLGDPNLACVPSTQQVGEGAHYYRVGSPIALETFPVLTERVE